jgi:hypothetical protein
MLYWLRTIRQRAIAVKYTLGKGTFHVVGYSLDGDSLIPGEKPRVLGADCHQLR